MGGQQILATPLPKWSTWRIILLGLYITPIYNAAGYFVDTYRNRNAEVDTAPLPLPSIYRPQYCRNLGMLIHIFTQQVVMLGACLGEWS